MRCNILCRLLVTITIVCRLFPTPDARPSTFPQANFSPRCQINHLDSVTTVLGSHSPQLSSQKTPPPRKLLTTYNILSGDIELNPGPPRAYNYPCGCCSNPVKSNQKGVCCDVCNKWFHNRCLGIPDTEYQQLQQSDDTWCCKICIGEALPFSNLSPTTQSSTIHSVIPPGLFRFSHTPQNAPYPSYTQTAEALPTRSMNSELLLLRTILTS